MTVHGISENNCLSQPEHLDRLLVTAHLNRTERNCVVAVLTQHDTDMADGIGLVQAVSRAVASSLRTSS